MSIENQLQQAINFSRDLYKTKKIYRSPILFVGRDAYEDFLDTRDTHVWTMKLCTYVPDYKDLYDVYFNLKSLGIHLESRLSPYELQPLTQHLLDSGAKAVFCTHLTTKETVVFSEGVKNAA